MKLYLMAVTREKTEDENLREMRRKLNKAHIFFSCPFEICSYLGKQQKVEQTTCLTSTNMI